MIKLRNLKNIVEKQLRDKPELRDSDSKLVARIWYNHISSRSPIPVSNMSATDLLIAIGNGELVGWSSITRVRRKIQQMNPDLRGKKYEKRQESTKTYIKEIKEFELHQLRKQINSEN
tara:strand:- start:286 stop:639 length:354 start_codon:yes stop_codon:yes gene_type:complete